MLMKNSLKRNRFIVFAADYGQSKASWVMSWVAADKFRAAPGETERALCSESALRPLNPTFAADDVGRDDITAIVNRKIIVCGLPDADQQRYRNIDRFKSLGIDTLVSLRGELKRRTIQLPYKMASTTWS